MIAALVVIGVVILLVCAGLVAIGIATAKPGYEDQDGFHYGEKGK
jgi:hypothetical protein